MSLDIPRDGIRHGGVQYETSMPAETKPITQADFNAYFERIFRSRSEPATRYPKAMVDWVLMHRHGIGGAMENEIFLMSPSEMRRAKEAGAIWFENEKGERIT